MLASHSSEATAAACLLLFRQGLDTIEIGKRLKIPEARASKLLWIARSRNKGLPAEFLSNGVVKRVGP